MNFYIIIANYWYYFVFCHSKCWIPQTTTEKTLSKIEVRKQQQQNPKLILFQNSLSCWL